MSKSYAIQTTYDAVNIIEGIDGEEHTQEEFFEAFQVLIDNGAAWSLQGSYGRTAHSLIESGDCHS